MYTGNRKNTNFDSMIFYLIKRQKQNCCFKSLPGRSTHGALSRKTVWNYYLTSENGISINILLFYSSALLIENKHGENTFSICELVVAFIASVQG